MLKIMKFKIPLIVLIFIFTLSGCSNKNTEAQMTRNNDLMPTTNIIRLSSAKEVKENEEYRFYVTDIVDDSISENYKLSNTLTITPNNTKTYRLYSSQQKTDNLDEMTKQEFNGNLKLTVNQPTYFVLTVENGPIDVTVSTME